MAISISQANRWLELDTKLGTDAFLATEVSGSEGISELFEFRVSALSPKNFIEPDKILGTTATLKMAHPSGRRRIVNGLVTHFSAGFVTRNNHRLYTLVVCPTLWTLGRTSDYKVYQDKTPVEIAEDLLTRGAVAFDKSLKGSYEKRDYCTQFGETDLAFLQRLLAEEGIFYYFTHSQSDHKMVLCDQANAYPEADQKTVEYRQDVFDATDAVHALDLGANLTDTSWTLRDYNYESAANPVEHTKKTALKPAASKKWEQFRYPGDGMKTGRLTQLGSVAIDAVDAGFEVVSGLGTTASFTPGHRFTIKEHPVDEVKGKEFVLTRVVHEARDQTYFTLKPGIEGKPFYRNSFTCIPAGRPIRPALPMPKPIVLGPQTALVVGTKGDVATDNYGRIQVRFFWDREGQKNNKATCHVRVAQSVAGDGWGAVFIPRGGMEVLVHFLDGDPDRPLVTGAVYNSSNAPPWISKENGTKSGLLTRSMASASKEDANELSFDDKAGSEKIVFHAQKDFLREVENDDTLDVKHDQTSTIKNDRKTTISEGNDALTVSKGNRTITISQGNQTTKAAVGSVTIEAMNGITLKCGENTIKLTQQGIEINGMQVKIAGTAKAETKAPIIDISADGMATVKGGLVKIN